MLNWINKKMKKRKGFTLVELVVVIAILGILAGIAVPKLGASRKTAQVSTHNANVRMLKSTAMMVIADEPAIASDAINDKVKALIDGEMPVSEIDGTTEFVVTLEANGDVKITPGEVYLNNGVITLINP